MPNRQRKCVRRLSHGGASALPQGADTAAYITSDKCL